MNASVTLKGRLRKYITSQVSPAPATHPMRRRTPAPKNAERRRYVAMTAPSIAEAWPAKTVSHFSGATRRARWTKRANMLLCWMSTNAAIAAANTATPISDARATAADASEFDRAASNATPARTKMSCVPVPTVMSTTMLAAACGPGTPRLWTSRAPATSPPTPATGNSELIDSRIQRIRNMPRKPGRLCAGSSSRHDSASSDRGARW